MNWNEFLSYKIPDRYRPIITFFVVVGWSQVILVYFLLPFFPDIFKDPNNDTTLGSGAGAIIIVFCFVFNLIVVTAAMAIYARNKDWWSLVLNCIFLWVAIFPMVYFPIYVLMKIMFIITPVVLSCFAIKILLEILREEAPEPS